MNRSIPIKERWKMDNEMMFYFNMESRTLPMILGGAVGDALGVPVEYRPRDSYTITDMTGYGTYQQPIGIWSDDTSLTMCLIESILQKENANGLLKRFQDYLENGYWTPDGYAFDIGISTKKAIDRFKKGISAEKCGGIEEYENGNGALMRISPLVPMLSQVFDIDRKVKRIEEVCYITHRHPRSTLACIIYIQFMTMLFNNNDKFKAYYEIAQWIKKYASTGVYARELPHFQRFTESSLHHLRRDSIRSDGYVVHTLEAALWCFLKHDTYKKVVLEAVNLGGDTDTVSFIAGTMAGLYYKMEGIPIEWTMKLKKIDELKDKCKEFCKFITKEFYG